jgi:hypothetical protein
MRVYCTCKVLVGILEGMGLLRRPRQRLEDIKIRFIGIGCKDVDWIHLA